MTTGGRATSPTARSWLSGGGNTGYQIATELSATHHVHLAIGTRQTPLPQKLAGRDLFWWLERTKLLNTPVDSRLGQKLRGRDTLIGASPRALRRNGVEIKPRTTAASGRAVSFADGTELSVDAVIWATGFGLDHTWVHFPVFATQGEVAHKRGVTATPGLYFLGLPWQHTRGSALLGWVKDDAHYLAQHISTYQRSLRRRPTMTAANDQFPTAISDLPACDRPDLIELSDGEAFDLRIAPVVKEIGEATVRMLAYNGAVPGPTLKVQQGSEIDVNVINDGDLEATVHWHGLRLENRYDGTHETQEPIQVGGSTRSRVTFPDPGVYWYHPHIREDYGQEMGLYGNVLVVPSDPNYWAPVHREVPLTLDDILIEDGKVAPFSRAPVEAGLARPSRRRAYRPVRALWRRVGPISTGHAFVDVVKCIPSYWLVQAGKSALGRSSWPPAEAWIVVAAWTVGAAWLAVLAYRRDTGRV